MTKTIKVPYCGKVQSFTLETDQYANGGLAVLLRQHAQAFATLSVWFPESADLLPGCFYLKDWSENAGIAEALKQAGVIVPVTVLGFVQSGFQSGFIRVSVYRLAGGDHTCDQCGQAYELPSFTQPEVDGLCPECAAAKVTSINAGERDTVGL